MGRSHLYILVLYPELYNLRAFVLNFLLNMLRKLQRGSSLTVRKCSFKFQDVSFINVITTKFLKPFSLPYCCTSSVYMTCSEQGTHSLLHSMHYIFNYLHLIENKTPLCAAFPRLLRGNRYNVTCSRPTKSPTQCGNDWLHLSLNPSLVPMLLLPPIH